VPDINTTDGCTAERQVYSGGDKGSTVEHFKITGGGHTWPGSAFVIGVTNQDIVACKEIWRFFRQYKLDQLSATNSPASMAENWSAYPNPAQDHLILESKNAAAVKQVQVWDALGRLQTSLKPGNENRIELNTAAWAQGIYWIVVEASGRVERIKVVKT
jgi:polyhydroxybutyrate depolymerase